MTELTEKQQTFLDNYIRQHRFSKGRQKEAEKFKRRKGKVLTALRSIPDFSPKLKPLQDLLKQADDRADEGDFKGAYKFLDQVKKQARKAAQDYDPSDDLNQLSLEVSQLSRDANQASQSADTLPGWLRTARQRMTEAMQIDPERGELGDSDQSIVQLVQLRKMEQEFWTDWDKQVQLGPAQTFLKDANQRLDDLLQKALKLEASCKNEHTRQLLSLARDEINELIVTNPKLMSLKVNQGEFHTPSSLQTLNEQQKKSFQSEINQKLTQLTSVQQGRDLPNSRFEATGPLSEESREDEHQMTGVVPRKGQEKRKFDLAGALTEKGEVASREEATQLQSELKQAVAQTIDELGAQSDEYFDLLLKSKVDLQQQIIKEKQWDPNQLTEPQKLFLEAAANGIYEAAREKNPIQMDMTQGAEKLTIGESTYTNRTYLAAGGGGTVYRYEKVNEDGSKSFVVLKTANEDLSREEMVQELQNHQRISSGDPQSRGRKNVLEMQGVAQGEDGSLHLVMDMAEFGNLNDSKLASAAAVDSGLISEEVRNLLNQRTLKQAIDGLIYVRDQGMVHFDLKEDNFFIGSDGQIKVADFGGSMTSDNDQGTVTMTSETAGSPGYQAPELFGVREAERLRLEQIKESEKLIKSLEEELNQEGLSEFDLIARELTLENKKRELEELKSLDTSTPATSSSDSYSLGRVAATMGRGLAVAPVKSRTDSSNAEIELSGALKRLTDGLTQEDPNQRITLEEAGDSSYVKNVDNYDEETLSQLAIALGKYSKTNVTKLQKHIAFLKGEIEGKQELLANPATSESKRQWAQSVIVSLQTEIQQTMRQLREENEKPEVIKLAEELRVLNLKLTRSSGVAPEDEQAREEFVKALKSTVSSAGEFFSYISLPSNGVHFKHFKIDQRSLIQAASCFTWDMSENNPNARVDLSTAATRIDEMTGTVASSDIGNLLGMGLATIYDTLQWLFDKSHGEQLQQMREVALDALNAGLPTFRQFVSAPANSLGLKLLGMDGAAAGLAVEALLAEIQEDSPVPGKILDDARNALSKFVPTILDGAVRQLASNKFRERVNYLENQLEEQFGEATREATRKITDALQKLSQREQEIDQLIDEGHRTLEAADQRLREILQGADAQQNRSQIEKLSQILTNLTQDAKNRLPTIQQEVGERLPTAEEAKRLQLTKSRSSVENRYFQLDNRTDKRFYEYEKGMEEKLQAANTATVRKSGADDRQLWARIIIADHGELRRELGPIADEDGPLLLALDNVKSMLREYEATRDGTIGVRIAGELDGAELRIPKLQRLVEAFERKRSAKHASYPEFVLQYQNEDNDERVLRAVAEDIERIGRFVEFVREKRQDLQEHQRRVNEYRNRYAQVQN